MAAASSGGILDALLGGEWEAEEALTASAVQEQLHRVDVRREEVLLTLYANIVERWPAAYDEDEQGEPAPPPDAATLESDAAFCSSLSSLGERGLAEEPAMAAILAAAGQHAAVCEQLRQALEAAGSVRVTAELQQRLADFNALAAQGSYTEAAWIVLELQKACQALPPGSDSGPQQEIDARVGPLLQHLQALVYSYVGVEQGTCMPQLLAPSTAAAEAAAEGEEAGAAAAWAAAAAAQAAADEQQQRQQLEEEEGQGTWAGCEGGASAGEQQYGAYVTATSAPGSEAVSRSDSISISTAAPGGAPSAGGGDDSGAAGAQGAVDGAAAAAAAAALADVWGALSVLGQLEQALAGLAAFFMEHSVRPIMASQADPSLLTDSPAPSVASTTFSRATQGGVGGGAGGGRRGEGRSSVERLLYKALRALVEQVLGGNGEYAEQLGAVLWPQLAAAYIATQLRPLKPEDDSGVEGFSRRSSLGAKLEMKAVKLGLLPAAASAACGGEGPISRYIRLTVGKLLAARRARLVSAARDLFTSQAAHETVQVGAPQAAGSAAAAGSSGMRSRQRREQQQQPANGGLEGDLAVLATGQYTVSQAAEQVVAMMRDALGEACSSGNPAVAQCMCAVVVDVAGLVASLPTAASAAGTAGFEAGSGAAGGAAGTAAAGAGTSPGELALPFPAALRHNDCHYVYQALLALPHQFSPRLQRLVHRGVSFSAPAARVRKAGDDCLEGMLQRQEVELQSLVDGLEGFQSLDGPGAIRCRKVVMQLLHSFRRLGSMVRGVLPPAVYIDVAARLVQGVCGRLIGEIMSMPDISVEESEQIPRILEELVTGVYDALLLGGGSAAGAAAAGGGGGGKGGGGRGQHGKESGAAAVLAAAALADAMQRQLEEKTPLVMKLRELLELLDIRLAEIRSRWTEGRLPALGFSAGEVSHLVTALFDHSNLRRDFLEQLEAEALM